MNSKRKDLLYATFFLIAVVLTFILGELDAFFLTSWRDLIPSILALFIVADFLRSSVMRIRRMSPEKEGVSWSTCIALFIFSLLFFGDLFFIGNFIFAQFR